MLKILQAMLQQYVNSERPDVQAGFRKDRGTRNQIANMCWIIEKQESSRKTSISALLTVPQEGLEEPSHSEGQKGQQEIPLIQGKEQQLRFAGAAVKRYPSPR